MGCFAIYLVISMYLCISSYFSWSFSIIWKAQINAARHLMSIPPRCWTTQNTSLVAMMNTPSHDHVLRSVSTQQYSHDAETCAAAETDKIVSPGPDRGSPPMLSSPLHVAFELIVVSQVTSVPCAGSLSGVSLARQRRRIDWGQAAAAECWESLFFN